jgi:hypothetical protein
MFAKSALVASFGLLLVLAALASELSPQLRALIDNFQAHRRIAIGYLRTENTDLAVIEIERLRDRWINDRHNIPAQVLADRTLAVALLETEIALRESLAAVNNGDRDEARMLLERAARPLTGWRHANGIRLFSDCIAEAGAAYERLDVHRLSAPKLNEAGVREEIVSAAAAAEASLARCDQEASIAIRNEPEFRRLVDGMIGSLRQVPEAVRRSDGAYLHRLLIEQRSFERLLAFRFG